MKDPKIAVVTPVGPSTDPAHLQQCHDSVRSQEYPAEHIIVYDGRGPRAFGVATLINLPQSANDIGSTPRAIGSAYSFGQGFDAVCFLDSDNWLSPDHVKHMVEALKTSGKPIIACRRIICNMDDTERAPCEETFENNGFWDTNTIMVAKDAKFGAIGWASLKPEHHKIGDRVMSKMWDNIGVHENHKHTVFYRSSFHFHYNLHGWDKKDFALKTLADL